MSKQAPQKLNDAEVHLQFTEIANKIAKQIKDESSYRTLKKIEIKQLENQGNFCVSWETFFIKDTTNLTVIKNCNFIGVNYIGQLEKGFLKHSNLILSIGLYSSSIINCIIGNNVVITNAKYLSNYIIGNEVILMNVNEMVNTPFAKFGNGVLFEDEEESKRIWIELCNENTGRKVLAFDGMLPADAFLWTQDRDNVQFQNNLKLITIQQFQKNKIEVGSVGDKTVIKNCTSIKDVLIGSFAYLKGVNKIKNVTIHSSQEFPTEIGEGCEIVNGIIGYNCRIFYGVKAVRFILSDHSQLKYGARLINSFLGYNSIISCCEVLNSLIFHGHAQHHNNSFLCAALIKGQSNIAAGATIGSNHNSRGADGEIVAGRGFWPALCVSLKHNSKFSSYNFIAKGDYNYEINNPFPFSLISNDIKNNELIINIGYWPKYNMYALVRNDFKYLEQDKRTIKTQYFDYNYLAPDTLEEIEKAIFIIEKHVGLAAMKVLDGHLLAENEILSKGVEILETKDAAYIQNLDIQISFLENSKRKQHLMNIKDGYFHFKDMIFMYGVEALLNFIISKNYINIIPALKNVSTQVKKLYWQNIGGQFILSEEINKLKLKIETNQVNDWDYIHNFYETQSKNYEYLKILDGLHYLITLLNIDFADSSFNITKLKSILDKYTNMLENYMKRTLQAREKDYLNPFVQSMFNNMSEMEMIYGKLNENKILIKQNNKFKKILAIINKINA